MNIVIPWNPFQTTRKVGIFINLSTSSFCKKKCLAYYNILMSYNDINCRGQLGYHCFGRIECSLSQFYKISYHKFPTFYIGFSLWTITNFFNNFWHLPNMALILQTTNFCRIAIIYQIFHYYIPIQLTTVEQILLGSPFFPSEIMFCFFFFLSSHYWLFGLMVHSSHVDSI